MRIETVPLSKIKPNIENPRIIKGDQYKRLVKSLREFPEMLKLRELVVDEDYIVLGGNMRLKALQEIGAKEAVVKVAEGLTPEQKREFVIKDNAAFGEWDFDQLANGWGDLPLAEWGVMVPVFKEPDEKDEFSDLDEKDKNIQIKISMLPGVWLGQREEIRGILDRLSAKYECKVKYEE